MARLIGVNIPDEKKIKISLRYLFGIGATTALQILKATNIDPEKRTKELTDDDFTRLLNYIEANFKVEGNLKQEIRENVRRLRDIRAYRGIRHMVNLPVRGQKTRKNARTRKGHNLPVGGLNPKITKT